MDEFSSSGGGQIWSKLVGTKCKHKLISPRRTFMDKVPYIITGTKYIGSACFVTMTQLLSLNSCPQIHVPKLLSSNSCPQTPVPKLLSLNSRPQTLFSKHRKYHVSAQAYRGLGHPRVKVRSYQAPLEVKLSQPDRVRDQNIFERTFMIMGERMKDNVAVVVSELV
jgi:hypothetical protein